ncbi:MAG: hypothetical protein KBD53_07125 [Candidatus Omnitrophica bacterium]|nr:hypothetical protein [Candidatus Omnitrophota bacterium]
MIKSTVLVSLLALLVLFTPATALAEYGVIVRTDKIQYKTGDDVIVMIKNELKEPISFLGMCSIKDCTKKSDEWQCDDKPCDAPEDVLVPGEKRDFRIQVVGLFVGDMKYKFEYKTSILEKDQTTYSNDFFVINTGKSDGPTIIRGKNYNPDEQIEIQSRIVELTTDGQPKPQKYIVKKKKESDFADKKSYIKKNDSKIPVRNDLSVENYQLNDNEVILAVRGLSKDRQDNLNYLLKNEFSSVQSIDNIGLKEGVGQYFVTLNISAAEFADELQKIQLPDFSFKVLHYSPNYIDCVLKKK